MGKEKSVSPPYSSLRKPNEPNAVFPTKVLMYGLVDFMQRHREDFQIFVCRRRNWQKKRHGRVSHRDRLGFFLANI